MRSSTSVSSPTSPHLLKTSSFSVERQREEEEKAGGGIEETWQGLRTQASGVL